MYTVDYNSDTVPLIMEGENTRVLGVGEVTGKIVVAQAAEHLLTDAKFQEPNIIPVVLDEFGVSLEGDIYRVNKLLEASHFAGFVTFGSNARSVSEQDPSHFMVILRDLAQNQEGFVAVVENDARDVMDAMTLRSFFAVVNGCSGRLTAVAATGVTPNRASIGLV